MSFLIMSYIRHVGCSNPDRQTGSDTLRYFGKSTDIFLFLRVASRPSNTSSQPSDTHSLRPKNSRPECLKSVISVTLDISGVAAHPDIGPSVARKCGKYIRVGPEEEEGGAHIWEQLMLASHCTVHCVRSRLGKGVIECNNLIYDPL